MPIYNEIFEAYRIEQKEIQNAVSLLKEKGFVVFKTKKDKNGNKKK